MSDKTIIHPAQDFALDRMHYGVRNGSEFYIVTSDRELFTTWDCERVGIKVAHTRAHASGFSWDDVMAYVNDGKEVQAAGLYKALRRYISDRIYLKEGAYSSLLALWTMGTYVHRIFNYYPYLFLHGIGRRCGRSVLMRALQPLVFNGILCAGLNESMLCRLADSAATLLLDDLHGGCKRLDTLAVLSSGFSNGYVVPQVERTRTGVARIRYYGTYSPKVLAGDAALWEAFWDKSLPIRMMRKGVDDELTPDLKRDAALASERKLRDELYIFGLSYAGVIAKLYQHPECLSGIEGLRDRERDLWQPIFVLAHIVDLEIGSEQVTGEMAKLRRACSIRNRQAELATCETTQLLVTWKEMMDRGIPSSRLREGDTLYYKTDLVFDYFVQTEEFSWVREPRTLSRKLQEVGITSEWKKTNAGRERLYKVQLAEFSELYERMVASAQEGSA